MFITQLHISLTKIMLPKFPSTDSSIPFPNIDNLRVLGTSTSLLRHLMTTHSLANLTKLVIYSEPDNDLLTACLSSPEYSLNATITVGLGSCSPTSRGIYFTQPANVLPRTYNGTTCSRSNLVLSPYNCYHALNWVIGTTYEFHMSSIGDGWFDLKFKDERSQNYTDLASVFVESNIILPTVVATVTNSPRYGYNICDVLPYSKVEFFYPLANHITPPAKVNTYLVAAIQGTPIECRNQIVPSQLSNSTIIEVARGNSARSPIFSSIPDVADVLCKPGKFPLAGYSTTLLWDYLSLYKMKSITWEECLEYAARLSPEASFKLLTDYVTA
eukprot:gene13419-15811_t